jgi:hypothetical protein
LWRKRAASSGAGEDAVGVPALHGRGSACAVDVATFDRIQLVRAEPGLGGEDDERPVDRSEFCGERVDLVARERQ